MNAVIIDLESDNLYPHETQTWTICLKRLQDDARLTLNPFRMLKQEVRAKLLDFIFKYPNPIIVGQFFDTLFASQFVYPDRLGGHSLRSWGEALGNSKIDYRTVALELGIIQPYESEFCRWSPQMDEYCQQDIEVTQEIFEDLYPIVEPAMPAFKLGQKNFFLMNAQAFTGFKFDIDC
jgi:hypothetical protein